MFHNSFKPALSVNGDAKQYVIDLLMIYDSLKLQPFICILLSNAWNKFYLNQGIVVLTNMSTNAKSLTKLCEFKV